MHRDYVLPSTTLENEEAYDNLGTHPVSELRPGDYVPGLGSVQYLVENRKDGITSITWGTGATCQMDILMTFRGVRRPKDVHVSPRSFLPKLSTPIDEKDDTETSLVDEVLLLLSEWRTA